MVIQQYLVQKADSERILATTRILLGALIPKNHKHIKFSMQNSETAVNGSQILAKSAVLKKLEFPQRRWLGWWEVLQEEA